MFGLISTGKLVMAGVAAAALLGGLLWVKAVVAERDAAVARAAVLSTQLDEATRVAQENADAAARIEAAAKKKLSAVQRERDQFAARNASLNKFFDEVRNAPSSDDGPVAPVLRRAVERMWDARPPDHADEGASPAH